MKDLRIDYYEVIFHCYKKGEWIKTFGAHNFNAESEPTKTETISLEEYDEVRVIQGDYVHCYVELKEEVSDNYMFKSLKSVFVTPDGDKWEANDISYDDIVKEFEPREETFNYYSCTKDGQEDIDWDNLTEDDEDLGW